MSVRRVMGTETEYGISVPGQPGANAMVTSSQVVNAYQAATSARTRRARWDFEEENPLRDARGFDLTREAADSSQLTDEDLGLANVILTNGRGRYGAADRVVSEAMTNQRCFSKSSLESCSTRRRTPIIAEVAKKSGIRTFILLQRSREPACVVNIGMSPL